MSHSIHTVTYFLYNYSLCKNAWQKTLQKQPHPVKGEFIHLKYLNLIIKVQQVEVDFETCEYFAFCIAIEGLKEIEDSGRYPLTDLTDSKPREPNTLEKDGWEKKEVPEEFLLTHHPHHKN